MSTRTNDHTLVKAGDNRRRRRKEPAPATTVNGVDPESPNHLDRKVSVTTMVADCGRPEVYATDNTNQTTGMCPPGAESTPASFTDEAATGLPIMVSSSLPKNRTARPVYTQQFRSLTSLILVHPARHIYHGRNWLSHYNVGQTYRQRRLNEENRCIHCTGITLVHPGPLSTQRESGLNRHTVATMPFWTTTFTGHTRWYTQHTTALTGRTTLPVSHSDLAYQSHKYTVLN